MVGRSSVLALCYLLAVTCTEVSAEGTSAVATTTSTATTKEPVLYCYDCNSANPACLGNATIDRSKENTAIVVTNCTAGQRCFIRENKLSKTDHIYRGCTKVIGPNLPDPLPPDGCYDYNGDNFCICSGDRCNVKPIGEPTGVKIDAHLKSADGGVLPPPYVPRGNKKEIVCNVCNSGKPGNKNFNCLPDRTANWKTTWKQNCAGRCITKTNFLDPEVQVFRECSDIWYKFPSPFPPDGCYEWYGDTVCVCNSDLCNSYPIAQVLYVSCYEWYGDTVSLCNSGPYNSDKSLGQRCAEEMFKSNNCITCPVYNDGQQYGGRKSGGAWDGTHDHPVDCPYTCTGQHHGVALDAHIPVADGGSGAPVLELSTLILLLFTVLHRF